MRLIIQRVKRGSVTVDGNVVGRCGKGAVCLVGIKKDDTVEDIDWIIRKTLSFCLWPDDDGRPWRKGIPEIEGEVLLVSQFTLYGRYGNGRRPDYSRGMSPEEARPMFDLFVERFKAAYNAEKVQTGEFGADMEVEIIGDGPVTFTFDSAIKRD